MYTNPILRIRSNYLKIPRRPMPNNRLTFRLRQSQLVLTNILLNYRCMIILEWVTVVYFTNSTVNQNNILIFPFLLSGTVFKNQKPEGSQLKNERTVHWRESNFRTWFFATVSRSAEKVKLASHRAFCNGLFHAFTQFNSGEYIYHLRYIRTDLIHSGTTFTNWIDFSLL